MPQLKMRQLQSFCTIVEMGFNISRAAKVLHASQPAISKQMHLLENDLGADLFERRGGRLVALTETGERTVVWARRAVQCSENIIEVAKEGSGKTGGTIALAAGHSHAHYLLLPAIVAFSKRFPRVRITVLQGQPPHVAELVSGGKAAIGVTHLPEELPKGILSVPFLTSSRLLVMPPGHPLLKEKQLTLEKIAPYPLIIPHSLRAQGARILQRFRKANLEVNISLLALDGDVIKSYVASGLGVGIIPAFIYSARKDRGLRVRDVGHLFEPAVSAVLLRKHSHLPKYAYQFFPELDPALEARRLENLVFDQD